MTVSYTGEVATCKGFGCFLKLLFRWKGSIYKLVWPDLVLFLGAFFSLSILYRFVLDEYQQSVFENIRNRCKDYGNLIPISFILGFYVSIVVGRWWDQYKSIPWADSIAVFVSANIQGQDEKGRVIRRTIMRYCCLTMTMCFTMISPRVKKRFPTLDHLVEAGLLLDNEKEIIDEINRNCASYQKSWIPIIWAASIVTRARKEGKIRDDFAVKTILDELNKFRGQCGLLISYDWISVPLVYTQVCTLAVYSYFAASMMGSQWIREGGKEEEVDLIVPIFTTLQFFFYMGWLKVAESLVNPFGDDDDDFELNWLVDRNLQVSYLIVDEMHYDHPELIKDQYWDEVYPTHELPYTVASEQYRDEPPTHSTANIKVSQLDGEIVSPPSVKLDEMSECGEVGRRVSLTPSKRSSMSALARRERTASVRSNASQSTLAESVSGKLSRAASITSVFKRMFSREPRERDNLHSPSIDGRPPEFLGSTTNVRKLLDDVIPELDENMVTIVSTRKEQHVPTVHEIFGTSPPVKDDAEMDKSTTEIPLSQAGPSHVHADTKIAMTSDDEPTIFSSTPAGEQTRPSFLNLTPATAVQSSPEELASAVTSTPLVQESPSSPDVDVGGDGDETMDDLHLKRHSGGKLTLRIAKTFGFSKDKNDSTPETSVPLMSDTSCTKGDSSNSEEH